MPPGSFKVCTDAKERVGCGKQREALRLFIASKTPTLVPEFAVEDLHLHRTATLVRAFAVKDLSLGRTLMMMMMMICMIYNPRPRDLQPKCPWIRCL